MSGDFAQIIMGLAANFGAKVPAGLTELWENAFREDGISLDQIRNAAGQILRSRTDSYGRMPTYAEFIEKIQGKQEDKAQIAANEIITHLKKHGANTPLKLNDQIAIHLMSTRWEYKQWASSVLEKELTWWVKDFCEAYRAYSKSSGFDTIGAPETKGQIQEGVKKLTEGIANEI